MYFCTNTKYNEYTHTQLNVKLKDKLKLFEKESCLNNSSTYLGQKKSEYFEHLSLMISNGCYKKLFTQFKCFLIFSLAFCTCLGLSTSDEPEPSWLEPQLELKDFQLGS